MSRNISTNSTKRQSTSVHRQEWRQVSYCQPTENQTREWLLIALIFLFCQWPSGPPKIFDSRGFRFTAFNCQSTFSCVKGSDSEINKEIFMYQLTGFRQLKSVKIHPNFKNIIFTMIQFLAEQPIQKNGLWNSSNMTE